MLKTCPDCRQLFSAVFRNKKGENMLPDIIQFNPKLKIICPACGHRLAIKYQLLKMLKIKNSNTFGEINDNVYRKF